MAWSGRLLVRWWMFLLLRVLGWLLVGWLSRLAGSLRRLLLIRRWWSLLP